MTRNRIYKISMKFIPVATHVTQNRISQLEIQEVIEVCVSFLLILFNSTNNYLN